MELSRCQNCWSLPPLGKLPFLKELRIYDFHGVEIIGDEFYGCDSPFRSLETLRFENMAEWNKWSNVEGNKAGAFPRLKTLELINCPKLSGGLPISSHTIENLDIGKCGKLETVTIEECGNLKIVNIEYCGKLEIITIKECGKLETVIIIACGKLETVTIEECGKLESLTIGKCGKLKIAVNHHVYASLKNASLGFKRALFFHILRP